MLELNGMRKSYNQRLVVDDLSMQLNAGEIMGLLGPNGAGKSTCIRMINQIIQPDAGSMKYQGDLLRQKHLQDFGYLPEERGLYRGMTVERHAVFLARLRGLSTSEAKKCLTYWLNRFDISDWKNKRIEELSKGMAQKVQFIMSVLHQPKVLILDEPFSGFDPLNIQRIRQEIFALKDEGRAILISTHNMNSVEELCDRAILVNKGKKIAEGSIDDLRRENHSGQIKVRFKGNMVGFVTALWTGFAIDTQREIGDQRYEVILDCREGHGMKELLGVLMDAVEIESIEERLPSMQDVFVAQIEKDSQKEVSHEE